MAKARAIVVDADLHAMATSDATPRELQLAKTTIVRDLSLAQSSLDGIAAALESRSLQDLPRDEPVIAAKEIVSFGAAR